MDFLYLFLSLVAVMAIMLLITFIRSYLKTKNSIWLYLTFFLYFILFFAMVYLNLFSFLFSNFKTLINNPILEISSIMIVTYIGVYFLKNTT